MIGIRHSDQDDLEYLPTAATALDGPVVVDDMAAMTVIQASSDAANLPPDWDDNLEVR